MKGGDWKWEVGMRKWEVGMRKWEVGIFEVGIRNAEGGNRNSELGMRKESAEGWGDRPARHSLQVRITRDFGHFCKQEFFHLSSGFKSVSSYMVVSPITALTL